MPFPKRVGLAENESICMSKSRKAIKRIEIDGINKIKTHLHIETCIYIKLNTATPFIPN